MTPVPLSRWGGTGLRSPENVIETVNPPLHHLNMCPAELTAKNTEQEGGGLERGKKVFYIHRRS